MACYRRGDRLYHTPDARHGRPRRRQSTESRHTTPGPRGLGRTLDDRRSCCILVCGLSLVLAAQSLRIHCPGAVRRPCVVQDYPPAQRCLGQGHMEVVERVDLLPLSSALGQVPDGHDFLKGRRIWAVD